MSTISLTTKNNKLLVSNEIIADSINVSDDIYVNHSIYTPVGSILSYRTKWLVIM